MATAGKVAPTPKDKFINGEPYEKLDVVEYNGNLYIAKKASSGVLPTDTEYWMLAVDLSGKLDTTGDTENNTVTFESGDETEPTEWKSVNVLASKEKHSSLFAKISTMFSNVRYLYKLLGTTDITALGSVTEAIATISGNVGNMKGISSSAAITTEGEYALDAREKNASVEGTLANQIDVLNSNLDNSIDFSITANNNRYPVRVSKTILDSANGNLYDIAQNGKNYYFRCNNSGIGFILLQQSNKNFAIYDMFLDNSKGSMQLVIKALIDGIENEYRFNPS